VAKPGEKQKLALRGKNLASVKEVKAEGATLKVLTAKAAAPPNNYPGERIGDSEVEIEIDVPKGAKAVKLIAVNTGGESNAYELLLRDDTPTASEKEDNGGFATAQPVPVPSSVEGTIKNERDVDVFKIEGKAGEKLLIEVQAARFGSPLDAFVTVHDADRKLLASADDTNGSPDPVLSVTLPKDGAYYVSLIDAHDLGGATFGYRLVLKKGK
jgi:Bacterial pre-peptidase C-terminal domain